MFKVLHTAIMVCSDLCSNLVWVAHRWEEEQESWHKHNFKKIQIEAKFVIIWKCTKQQLASNLSYTSWKESSNSVILGK